MGKAIQNAVRHFEGLGPVRIEIEQWSDEDGPLVIVAEPMTLEDKIRMAEITTQRSALDGMIWVLLKYAKDEDGNRIFDLEDKVALKTKVDPDIISDIVQKITRSQSVGAMENF